MKRNLLKIYVGLIFSILIWSYSFAMIKICYNYGFTPLLLVNVRLLVGALILFTLCRWKGFLQQIRKEDRWRFILLAFFEPFLYYIGESISLTYISASTVAVFIGMIPVFTPFFMYFAYNEKLRKSVLISTFFSFIGILLVFYSEIQLSGNLIGFLFIFLSIFSALGYTAFVKELVDRYNPYFIVLIQELIGAFFFLPLVLIKEFQFVHQIQWNFEVILYVFLLAFFASSLAYVFYSSAIQALGATRTSIFSNLIPVFATIGALLTGLETPDFIKITGILIVISSVFALQYYTFAFRKQFSQKIKEKIFPPST
jgi:drug/metabolite transporter (DMT)-like permease